MSIKILTGDCRELLKTLDAESVNCCVTSPPYFGLRDYGVNGQIGLEQSPQELINELVDVFREVKRVLRSDGTLWLNLGDSYTGSGKGGNPEGSSHKKQATNTGSLSVKDNIARSKNIPRGSGRWGGGNVSVEGLPRKNLIGVPWRVAFALQEDGWILRQDIIWSKPNPMPESVTDRCTKAHEYMFLLSKSEKYYFDQEAILEPMAASSVARLSQNIEDQTGSTRVPGKTNGNMKAVGPRFGGNKYGDDEREESRTKLGNVYTGRKPKGNAKTFRGGGSYTKGQSFDNSATVERESHGNAPNETGLRNPRSVWTIATQPFKEAHFATFPQKLIEPCIKAGCPEGGLVLDPFGGAGTTGLVCDRLQRNALLMELNPEYATIAKRRIGLDSGMFSNLEKDDQPENELVRDDGQFGMGA